MWGAGRTQPVPGGCGWGQGGPWRPQNGVQKERRQSQGAVRGGVGGPWGALEMGGGGGNTQRVPGGPHRPRWRGRLRPRASCGRAAASPPAAASRRWPRPSGRSPSAAGRGGGGCRWGPCPPPGRSASAPAPRSSTCSPRISCGGWETGRGTRSSAGGHLAGWVRASPPRTPTHGSGFLFHSSTRLSSASWALGRPSAPLSPGPAGTL